MSKSWEVAVVGLGAMGSAALYHLARRGVRVIGFDRFSPPHTRGSTHGLSRIIREAYYEHPVYVPLVQRAYELWADLERQTGRVLFVQTGGLMIGPRDGTLVAGARRSAREHALAHEELSAREVQSRFPGFAVPDEMAALFEPRAGVLDPEACVASHLQLAANAGADIHLTEAVSGWRSGNAITLETPNGRYDVGRVALCAGAWTPTLLSEGDLTVWIERQVMHWFTPRSNPELFASTRCPIAMIEYAPDRFFYTLPDSGSGVKAAIHHEGARVDPDDVNRAILDAERERVLELLRRYLPRAAGRHRQSATCLYTNTPDGHFFIASYPPDERLLVVSACSGHGFKFASAVGEAIADLYSGQPRPDLVPFGPARPAAV